jgi:hypothetical protein
MSVREDAIVDTDTSRPRWHDAAASATLTPYQVTDSDDPAWAGGFGGGPGFVTTHLEVNSLVDGIEVSVDTIKPDERRTDDLGMTLAVHDLVGQYLLERVEITLPFVVSVVPDDRHLTVDGVPQLFRGARVDGDSRWIGECNLGVVRLRVATRLVGDLALSRVVDLAALPEFPPGHG